MVGVSIKSYLAQLKLEYYLLQIQYKSRCTHDILFKWRKHCAYVPQLQDHSFVWKEDVLAFGSLYMHDFRDTIVVAHTYAIQSAEVETMGVVHICSVLSDDVELFVGYWPLCNSRKCQCSGCGCLMRQSHTHNPSALVACGMARSLRSGMLLRSGFVESSIPSALHCGRSSTNTGTNVAEG